MKEKRRGCGLQHIGNLTKKKERGKEKEGYRRRLGVAWELGEATKVELKIKGSRSWVVTYDSLLWPYLKG